MRKLFYLCLFLAATMLQAQKRMQTEGWEATQAPQPNVRYASFNIRYKDGDQGTVRQWSNRRDSLCRFLNEQHLDIFGAQEVLHSQLKDMLKRMPAYGYVGVGREDGKNKGERAAIFYHKDKWEAVKSGNFWLSETPDVVGSVGWDAALPRICTWALLQNKEIGVQLMAVNTHFDHVGTQARSESALLILRKIREIVGDTPFVLTGDFNVDEADDAYKTITTNSEYPIVDTQKTRATHRGTRFTYHGWGNQRHASKIDFVFTSPSIETCSTFVPQEDKRSATAFYMSDHNPIIVELAVPTTQVASVVDVRRQQASVNIVFIGNSITQGATLRQPATEAPPVKTAAILEEQLGRKVQCTNCGKSGSTTVNWLPGTAFFNSASQVAANYTAQGGQLIFSISLGTNDSAETRCTGSPVSPADYQEHLRLIIDSLRAHYPHATFIINYPIWYSSNTHNSAMYLEKGLARLHSYYPYIDALAKEYRTQRTPVWAGDSTIYTFFENHTEYFTPEKGHSGTFYLHPNTEGGTHLATFWAAAIKAHIKFTKRSKVQPKKQKTHEKQKTLHSSL